MADPAPPDPATRWVVFIRVCSEDGGCALCGPVEVRPGEVLDLVLVGFDSGYERAVEFSAEVALDDLARRISLGWGMISHPACVQVYEKGGSDDPPGGEPI